MADPNAATRAEFVGLLRALDHRRIHLKRSVAERFPELKLDSSRSVAA